MPLLLGCGALFFPRLVMFLVFLLAPAFFGPAFGDNFLLLIVGFLFLPLTSLAYAWLYDPAAGGPSGFALVVVIVAVLMDLGLIGGSARYRR